jgi:hypothetical protein
MIKKWLLLLKQIGRRVDKVKFVRELILIAFNALIFGLAVPFVATMLTMNQRGDFTPFLIQNPAFLFIITTPFILLAIPAYFIHKIDDWEDKKANGRFEKQQEQWNDIKNEIHMLASEIRQSRKQNKKG